MMDYDKTRTEALARKEMLNVRQQDIAKEHKRLDDELEQVRRELIGLDQIIEGLDVVTTDTPPDLEPPALTDHIRKTLQQTTVHLLPTQIRDACLAAGIKGSSLKNLLISVHNVLSRLDANLDKAQVENKTAYKWKAPAITPGATTEAMAGIGSSAPAYRSKVFPRRRIRTSAPPSIYSIEPPPAGGVPNPLGKNLSEMLKEKK